MASGTIVCAGLQKVLKEEINGRVSFDTTFYTEMVKWKRGVIETVHQACHSTPALIAVTTGEAAQAVKHGDLRYRCSIAIKGLECDDISTCSSTQKSEPWHCLYPLLNRSMWSRYTVFDMYTVFISKLPLALIHANGRSQYIRLWRDVHFAEGFLQRILSLKFRNRTGRMHFHPSSTIKFGCLDPGACEVTDNAGRSGRSYNEFIAYMQALPWNQRPCWVIIECVANLNYRRAELQERSTAIVSSQLSDLGYVGSWKVTQRQRWIY